MGLKRGIQRQDLLALQIVTEVFANWDGYRNLA